jgi:hypothetical protein
MIVGRASPPEVAQFAPQLCERCACPGGIVGGAPSFVAGLAHDDVQTDAEGELAAEGGGALLHMFGIPAGSLRLS